MVFVSPGAAIDCAVAILRSAARHSAEHPERPLRIGMGLHAGETVPFDDQFVGSAVNVGARLASKAGPGELVVSDTFRGLVRTGVSYPMSDRGALRLKGVAERIRAWRVEWDAGAAAEAKAAAAPAPKPAARELPLPGAAPPPPPRPGELLSPVVVGRERELALIDAALDDAAAGSGALLLVSGEAGVGKSALMRVLQRRAAARSFVLLPGVTLESDGGLPYAPVISALRSGYREGERADLRRALDRTAPDLVALFPELGRFERDVASSSPVERHRIPIAFATFVAQLSAAAPVLLLLEDLHWADEATLELVERLGRELARWRLVLAATYRSDELHRLHPLLRVVSALRRDRLGRHVQLEPLGRDESAALIRAAAGDDPRITTDLAEAVAARAQGNPFFIEELLRAVADGPATAAGRIPATVRDTVRARLARIDANARATIAAASVLGERATFDLLQTMRAVDPSVLADELRAAVDENLLVELDDPHTPAYGFRHALTREVVYEQMLLPERRRLHLLAAGALAADPLTAPASLAEQWRLGGERARAGEAHQRAAQSAMTLYAPREAIAHIERAIEMRGATTVEDYELMARAYLFFDPVKAREAAERGLETMGADEPALRRIRLMRTAGRARYALGDAEGNAALAREGWALAEPADDAARAEAADWLARAHLTGGDMDAARSWSERAVEAARASGELALEGSALSTIAAALMNDRPLEGLRLLDDAAALARRTGSVEVMSRVHSDGVLTSIAVETERQRLVRIERALEFTRRYGVHGASFETMLLSHEVVGLHPITTPAATVGEAGPQDLFSTYREMLLLLWDSMRQGPRQEAVARSRAVANGARDTGEAQWAVPVVSGHGVLAAFAGDGRASADAYAEVLAAARTTTRPELALIHLARGLHTPAALAYLHGDATTLDRAIAGLEGVEGYIGDREALLALRAALAGRDPREDFERAASAHGLRGLRLGTAVLLWALASRGAVGADWSGIVGSVGEDLKRAGADWLANAIASGPEPLHDARRSGEVGDRPRRPKRRAQ